MRKFVLAAVLVLVAGGAQAASYQTTTGTIVDPIQTTSGTDHFYVGESLHPFGDYVLTPNLTDANLTNADLRGATLFDANLSGATLTNADLTIATLSGANLGGADLTNAEMIFANLTNANLTNANLTDTILANATLNFANLTNANLTNANLTSALLGFTNLNNANLTNANLGFAQLDGADFSNAILANAIGLGSLFGENPSPLYNANTDFTGTFFDPVAAGWTLAPIPEPNTALLLSLGLTGLSARRRSLRA